MINYLLDTNIVSKLCHPKKAERELLAWYSSFCLRKDIRLYLPEIVAYEVRRGLISIKLRDLNCKSLDRFERFCKEIDYLPMSIQMWKLAAQLWAEQQINGTPNASPHNLDGDVLLAAQAREANGIVITENVRHLSKMTKAERWRDV